MAKDTVTRYEELDRSYTRGQKLRRIFVDRKGTDLAAWLRATDGWTPLHHLEQLTPKRKRALLRGGAALHAGAPSPLERARAVGGEVSALLLRAARWSEGSHELFPAPGRAQAVAVLRLGYLLASAQYPMEAVALVDAWRHIVLPHAITRDAATHDAPSPSRS